MELKNEGLKMKQNNSIQILNNGFTKAIEGKINIKHIFKSIAVASFMFCTLLGRSSDEFNDIKNCMITKFIEHEAN